MKIEIIKQFRLLEVGKQLDTDLEWATSLIERGFAKNLEVVEVSDEAVEKPKKEKLIKEK